MAFEKAGNVRKCPSCGEVVPSMTSICSSCRHEFNNMQVSSTLKSFFEKFVTIRNEKEKLLFISGFPIPNTKEDILEFAILASSQIRPVHGMAIIGVWYLRFVTLGIIHLFWKGPEALRFNKIWMSKIKQIKNKGRIAFINDSVALTQLETIAADVEKELAKSRKSLVISIVIIIAFFVLYEIFYS
ncbi:MAG: hypothetical protein LBC80_08615 [Treponema sp.]|jgi:hypothetical protein|nr:hypothetical protein [Treponema sp.]